MKRIVTLLVRMVVLILIAVPFASAEDGSMRKMGSIYIPWRDYEKLVKDRFLPTLPEMSDSQLAERLDLTRPQLAEVKKAYDAKDGKALENALGNYLNTIYPPMTVKPTGKPPANASRVDPYLKTSIDIGDRHFELGEHGEKINWWNSFDNPDRSVFMQLAEAVWLAEAYGDCGDIKYAERAIDFVRSFYHNARPPAQRQVGWGGLGPWTKGGFRFHPGYMPVLYRNIGASAAVTDADRVMILKMASENGDYYAKVLEFPTAHNFLVGLSSYSLYLSLDFKDFKDQPVWLKSVANGLNFNIHAAVGEDGGAYERTAYNFAFLGNYRELYKMLARTGAPLPDSFKTTVENMHQWSIWMLTPTKQWPVFGHGSIQTKSDYVNFMQGSVDVFPDAGYIRHFVTDGKEGKPLDRVARAMSPSGFVSMRTDWSEDALYMSLKFNDFLRGAGGHHDAMSFGLFAYGLPLMTNPGTAVGYGESLHDEWIMDTLSHNTLRINWRRHDILDNTGRLETWASLPEGVGGFTYFAANSHAYESQNADHRRAVLFLRPQLNSPLPGYWLIYDTVEFPRIPSDFDSYPYDIVWLGHFQPTKLTIDPKTKVTVTAEKDGKRLYVVPLEPERMRMQEDEGIIITPEKNDDIDFLTTGLHPYMGKGPYIKLEKRAVEDFGTGFGVVLFPTRNNAPAPAMTSLLVQEAGKPLEDRVAIGAKVSHAGGEDVLAMAKAPALRTYGEGSQSLTTDAETAYVRSVGGQIVEAGLVNGSVLESGGVKMIHVTPNVTSVRMSREEGQIRVDARGHGLVIVSAGRAAQFVVNGNVMQGKVLPDGLVELSVGVAGKVVLSKPAFSTDPKLICGILNVPYGHQPETDGKPGTGYLGPNRSIAVTWTTDVPSDATLEYRVAGEKTWLRSINPELLTNHDFVLSQIKSGAEYEIRITSVDANGRSGRLETRIPKSVTRTVRQ